MIIAIKTDVPVAEIYIVDKNGTVIVQKKWHAHRQLLETIHVVLKELVEQADATLQQLDGVVFYEGPGSFTGLRIGCSVANALATSYDVPIVATTGPEWLKLGAHGLASGKGTATVEPNYGQEPRITTPS